VHAEGFSTPSYQLTSFAWQSTRAGSKAIPLVRARQACLRQACLRQAYSREALWSSGYRIAALRGALLRCLR